jgi:DNA-binding transcriptional LysR family regulator
VGFSPRVSQEALRLPSTLNFVAAGLGVSIVPASLKKSNVEGVIFCRLTDSPDLKAPLYMMHRSGRPTGAVASLLNQVKNRKKVRAA